MNGGRTRRAHRVRSDDGSTERQPEVGPHHLRQRSADIKLVKVNMRGSSQAVIGREGSRQCEASGGLAEIQSGFIAHSELGIQKHISLTISPW